MMTWMNYISLLVDFVFSNPAVASAWATIGGGVAALVVGIPTLTYLVKYTRRTSELRDEARRQTAIQGDVYEASVMPLLVAEFGVLAQKGDAPTDAVLLRNLGRGPALGVQVEPIRRGANLVRFDYIPIIECGGSAPIVCIKGTPAPSNYDSDSATVDHVLPAGVLHRYARHYILGHSSADDNIKAVTRSLSNTVHEFNSSVELRGSDDFAVLVYKGKTSRPAGAEDSATGSTAGL